jgi:hypothetical protein
VAINDTATAQITTLKNLGITRITYKPRHARAHTYLDTRSQKKHRWQLVTQLLTNHNTQRGQNTNTKHTHTHTMAHKLRASKKQRYNVSETGIHHRQNPTKMMNK